MARNAFLIFLLSLAGLAADAQIRKYSNEFLAIGVGARALAMSNAYTSTVNDVTSGYWNPAGILEVQSDMQVGLMHSEYFAGIAKYDYGALAKPIDSASAISFSLIRFGVDDIPNTTDLIDNNGNIDYSRITTFSAADYAGIISYAKRLKIEGLRVGANAKIIHRRVGDMARAWGFGLDVGMKYDYEGWQLAAMARDVTSTFNAWSFDLDERTQEVFKQTNNEIPESSLEITLPRLILGASRQYDLGKKFTLLAALDLDMTFDGKRNTLVRTDPWSMAPRLGLEAGYAGVVFLRGGVGNFQRVTDVHKREVMTFQPNLGVGVRLFDRLTIDYALTDIGDQSIALYSNVFSLQYDIYNQEEK